MNGFALLYTAFLLIRWVWKVTENQEKPVLTKIRGGIHPGTGITYWSNHRKTDNPLQVHYLLLLQLENEKHIDTTKITEHGNRQLAFLKDVPAPAQPVKDSANDILAAEAYLCDLCNYLSHTN